MTYGYTWFPYINGIVNPYYGGFGHFRTPSSGAGFAYPGFTWPFAPGGGNIAPGL